MKLNRSPHRTRNESKKHKPKSDKLDISPVRNFVEKNQNAKINQTEIEDSLRDNEESYQKESERLMHIYNSINSQKIDNLFKEKITEFYQGFSKQIKSLLAENRDLKKMLKALYTIHLKSVAAGKSAKKENGKKELERQEAQTKEKYKRELARVRESASTQIKKLQSKLQDAVDELEEARRNHKLKMEQAFEEWNDNQEAGLKLLREEYMQQIEYERKLIEDRNNGYVKEFANKKNQLLDDFEKEKTTLKQQYIDQKNLLAFEYEKAKRTAIDQLRAEQEEYNLEVANELKALKVDKDILKADRERTSKELGAQGAKIRDLEGRNALLVKDLEIARFKIEEACGKVGNLERENGFLVNRCEGIKKNYEEKILRLESSYKEAIEKQNLTVQNQAVSHFFINFWLFFEIWVS